MLSSGKLSFSEIALILTKKYPKIVDIKQEMAQEYLMFDQMRLVVWKILFKIILLVLGVVRVVAMLRDGKKIRKN